MYSIALTQVHKSAGTRPFVFLNIDYNAYSVAMGGASVAVPTGANEVIANPAGQAFTDKSIFFLSYYPIYDGIQGSSIGLSRNFDKYGHFALSVTGLTSGEMSVVEDNNGQPFTTGEKVSMNSVAGGISWAYKFNSYFSAGITCRAFMDEMSIPGDNVSAGGAAFDLGIQYRFFKNRLIFGGVVRNIGFVVKGYNGIDSKMPSGIDAGFSYVPRGFSNLRLALDVSKHAGDFLVVRPGLELYVIEKILAIRLGFPFSSEDLRNLGSNDIIKSNANGFAVGIGLNPKIKNTSTRFNFGLQLKTEGLPPSLLVSNTTEF